VGLLFGSLPSYTVTNSFYRDGLWNNGIGTPVPESLLAIESTFTSAGWDFVNIWDICEETNYPRFLWQILPADLTCPYGVSLPDFSIFARAWHSTPIDEHWDSDCDLDGDEHIGTGDLAIASGQWMEGM
jgi:hypothetical protein